VGFGATADAAKASAAQGAKDFLVKSCTPLPIKVQSVAYRYLRPSFGELVWITPLQSSSPVRTSLRAQAGHDNWKTLMLAAATDGFDTLVAHGLPEAATGAWG
jgi:hypothetical protein